ncbi:MAG: enoyl-CoA hydratase/isomerase family protein [Peptococcia bacterium]
MSAECVLLEITDSIATITLNRPAAYNAITPELNSKLQEILIKAEAAPQVKVIVLTGAGKAFCAGGDLGSLAGLKDLKASRNFIAESGKTAALIYRSSKPVIAMVNGVAAGAGFNIALLSDIVICAESARFAQSFAKIGLIPDWGGHYLLPRAIGLHKAKELMFTAELIDAEHALRLGIVNKVVKDDQLRTVTYDYARKLANSASLALGIIKSIVNQSVTLTLENTLALETDAQTLCLQSQDCQEGIRAFREKRPANFKGY